MPSGYLKHNKRICRKQRRGGSSYHAPWSSEKGREKKSKLIDFTETDFTLDAPKSFLPVDQSSSSIKDCNVGECIICFEKRPVITLIKQCSWHAAACHECLHRLYVSDAQKSTKNYPLKCFHPQCGNKVRSGPLEHHQIFETPEEKKEHHRMMQYSRNKKRKERTVFCPKCHFPKGIKSSEAETHTGFKCKCCKFDFFVTPAYPTIRALENFAPDSFGVNYGWAFCPSCNIFISKGDGCLQMECGYCHDWFWWDEAQEETQRIYSKMARPPDEEIHLWW